MIGGASERGTVENADLDRVNERTNHSCNAQERFVKREYGVVDRGDRRLAGVGVDETEE